MQGLFLCIILSSKRGPMPDPMVGRFVKLSTMLTAFSAFDLYGTGEVAEYYGVLSEIVGAPLLVALFDAADDALAASIDPKVIRAELRARVFSDPTLGPVARNIIKMWYIGNWYELPPEWREANGTHLSDYTRVVSAAAYVEGLLWPAIGANPSGAKAPGYASWQNAPTIPRPPANAI